MKTILTMILALLLMAAWVEATLVLSQTLAATVVSDSVTLALTMLALMLLALAGLRWAWRAKASKC